MQHFLCEGHFLAADALRSRTRYAALDETGVVGVVCKHEIPQLMLSLKHWERHVYIIPTDPIFVSQLLFL